MSISITESASEKVKMHLIKRGKGLGIRIGVKPSGCSGMSYVMEFVDQLESEDLAYENHGVMLVTDPKSLLYIDGMQVDWKKEGLNEGFSFENPNISAECGCGESFNV